MRNHSSQVISRIRLLSRYPGKLKVNTPGRPARSVPAMVAGFALRARAHRRITSWLVVTRLRPGRSGWSAGEPIRWEDRTEREVAGPVRIPLADPAAALPAGAALRADAGLRAGADLPAVVFRVVEAAAGRRAEAEATLRADAGAALRADAEVALRAEAGAALRVRAGAALARVDFAPVVARAPERAARPAGPVLVRPAPPDRRAERIARARAFTSSGLRSPETPETPCRRSRIRSSSTRIRAIAVSEISGVPGVRLPTCRFVLVAVPPRPELLR
ncbi:hypothetical protein GCM10012279_33870 [Micromonospora yangpuensis]|nr:hypothetical protein GCM10012279_33870 [Micromonospora yangpuensis]